MVSLQHVLDCRKAIKRCMSSKEAWVQAQEQALAASKQVAAQMPVDMSRCGIQIDRTWGDPKTEADERGPALRSLWTLLQNV